MESNNKISIVLTPQGHGYIRYYNCGQCLTEDIIYYDKIISNEIQPRKKLLPYKVMSYPCSHGDEIHVFVIEGNENSELELDFSGYGTYCIEKMKIHSKIQIKSLTIKSALLCSEYYLENNDIQTSYVN